jgi:hypothetical protein
MYLEIRLELLKLKELRIEQEENSCSEIKKDIQKEINNLIDEVDA